MTVMPAFRQFVSLVSKGGVPVTLADAFNNPYPTTGQGALVFNQGPEIYDAKLYSAVLDQNSIVPTPLTSLGDLYYHDGTGPTRFPMGGPGQALMSSVNGLVWGA